MSNLAVEIVELGSGRFLIELEDNPAALGPLTRKEMQALFEALEEWTEEQEY